MEEKGCFKDYFLERKANDSIGLYDNPAVQKAYFIGAYARAVINSSYNSDVSKKNTTYKNWLSNQIINYRNLDRIFEMAFRFEQKLKLRIKNDSEVRRLAHELPASEPKGLSSAQISYAFVSGYDDYEKYRKDNKNQESEEKKNEQ